MGRITHDIQREVCYYIDKESASECKRKRQKGRSKMQFNESRRFGIEIEFTSKGFQSFRYAGIGNIARRLSEATGIEVEPERYNHDTREYWKLTTDASCGFELVSPPLKGRAGLAQVDKMMTGLKQIGAHVSSKCGLHVHHEANDLDLEQLKSIAKLYAKYETAFDNLTKKSRRASVNHYCNSMLYGTEDLQSALNRLDVAHNVPMLCKNSRYHKVNFMAFAVRGTVEFRQHHGTLSGAKAVNWIVLTQAVVERSRAYRVSNNLPEGREFKNLVTALNARSNNRTVAQDDLGRDAHWYFYRVNRQNQLAA